MGSNVILLVLSIVHSGASLECYKCTAVLDLVVCDTTQRCYDGQVCFLTSTVSREIQVTSLGCTARERCGVQNIIQSSTVGREIEKRETTTCSECCSTDMCNKHLCQHLKPSVCADDESVDCAKMDMLFSICNDTDNAEKVCPKFCGLCYMYVVDGSWSNWSKWSQCDVTCGKGTQTRNRLCNNPSPEHGGKECLGIHFSSKSCFMELCPVDGGWSPWEAWVSCSTSCDIGLQSRERNCSNPVPERNGQHCFGKNVDVRQCMPGPCANGGWSDWGSWNPCSVTCGVGIRSKSRSCTNPRPSPFGQYCTGEHSQIESCTKPKCAVLASDCHDILKMNIGRRSGVYLIKLWKSGEELEVFCDLETANGGWTVFQLRFDGSLDFHRNFANYTAGFGNVYGEFWLGLQNVYEMVSKSQSELRIDLEAADGTKAYETFQDFSLSPGPNYTLHISKGTGTAGDSDQGLSYHNNLVFSTYDHGPYKRCASSDKDYGGWWYHNCAHANLNGKNVTPGTKNPVYAEGGVTYREFQGVSSLKQTKMMFRPN